MGEEAEGRIGVVIVKDKRSIFVRAEGLAMQDNCAGLRDFMEVMFAEGYNRVVVDLGECQGMDSTFIGTLAFAVNTFKDQAPEHVFLLNPSLHEQKGLRMIGLLPRVTVEAGAAPLPSESFGPVPAVHLPANETERLQEIKRIHEELIKLNERNQLQFGAVVDALEKALDQKKGP